MTTSKSQAKSRDKWDRENMSYQTVKVKTALLEAFKAKCARNGDKVNTVLRKAIEKYVEGHQD